MPVLQPTLSLLLWSVMFMSGFSVCGWWLAALQAPWFLWLSSGCLLLYLLVAGTAGIVLASLWITGVIFAVLATNEFPHFWPENAPYQPWARVMLSVWGFSNVMVYLLGRHSEVLRMPQKQATAAVQCWYLAACCLGLYLGRALYYAGSLAELTVAAGMGK